MTDSASRGLDFLAKAEKKLKGMSFFGNKHEEAVELLEKAANCFKLAKMCTCPVCCGAPPQRQSAGAQGDALRAQPPRTEAIAVALRGRLARLLRALARVCAVHGAACLSPVVRARRTPPRTTTLSPLQRGAASRRAHAFARAGALS